MPGVAGDGAAQDAAGVCGVWVQCCFVLMVARAPSASRCAHTAKTLCRGTHHQISGLGHGCRLRWGWGEQGKEEGEGCARSMHSIGDRCDELGALGNNLSPLDAGAACTLPGRHCRGGAWMR